MINNFLISVIFLFQTSAFAIDLYQMGQSARSHAMGGTSISFVRGVDALFSNPAALTKVDGFSLNIVTFSPTLSSNSQTLYDKLSGGDDFTAEDMNDLYGKQFFTDLTAYSGLVIPYFGVGAYSNNTILQSFSDPAFPTFSVDFTSDYAYVLGAGIAIGNNFSLGLSGRHVKRWSGKQDINVGLLLGSNSQDVIEAALADKGKGNALDLAALATFPGTWNMSYAAVWKDVGDTKFEPTAGVGPERQENNLMFGVSAQKDISFMSWTNALEYKFIRNDGEITKKIHLGTELSLGLFDLRAGYGQGYLSYGAAFDLSFLRIEAAVYSAELGAAAGQTQNERYQASISLNLDFDKSFKLQASDGKRRRLIQRR